jgi:hypothetical protein
MAPIIIEPTISYTGLGKNIVRTDDIIGTKVDVSVIAFSNKIV